MKMSSGGGWRRTYQKNARVKSSEATVFYTIHRKKWFLTTHRVNDRFYGKQLRRVVSRMQFQRLRTAGARTTLRLDIWAGNGGRSVGTAARAPFSQDYAKLLILKWQTKIHVL